MLKNITQNYSMTSLPLSTKTSETPCWECSCIWVNHRRKIFGVEVVNVTFLNDVGQPASASCLGPGCWTSVNVSTLTAEAKHLILLLHPYLKLCRRGWRNTDITDSNTFWIFRRFDGKHRYHWQQWFWIVKQAEYDLAATLSGCLWRVIPLLQEQHGGWGGGYFPQDSSCHALSGLHPQQPWPDDLWLWTNLWVLASSLHNWVV